MKKTIFGEMIFNTGWKVNTKISLLGKGFDITIKAKAYREEDGISYEQAKAFADFDTQKSMRLKTTEYLLNKFSKGNTTERFIPRTLLFQRDGSYALLCDDREDEDDGVAVCLSPEVKVISQDEYL
jgi:hypothetical protein